MSEKTNARSNRRLSQRRVAKRRVKVTCRRGALDLGANLALLLLDLSETGVRLVVSGALQPGVEVTISLEGQSRARPLIRLGNVAWCMPTEPQSFCIGVNFQKRLPYRDFLELCLEPASMGTSRVEGGQTASPNPVGPQAALT
jgi:PilZ domain